MKTLTEIILPSITGNHNHTWYARLRFNNSRTALSPVVFIARLHLPYKNCSSLRMTPFGFTSYQRPFSLSLSLSTQPITTIGYTSDPSSVAPRILHTSSKPEDVE